MGIPQGASQVCRLRERKLRGNLGAFWPIWGLLAYLGPAGSQEEAGPTAGEASREGNRRQKGTSWTGTARLEGSRDPEGQVSERRMALGCL